LITSQPVSLLANSKLQKSRAGIRGRQIKFRQTGSLHPLSPKLHTWYDDTGSRRTTPAHLEESLIVSLPKAYLALAVPCLRSVFAAWTGVVNLCLSICKKRRHTPFVQATAAASGHCVSDSHTKETHKQTSRQAHVVVTKPGVAEARAILFPTAILQNKKKI
ncbi:hypothetical protein T10_9679, partial [Trichinella papuae]